MIYNLSDQHSIANKFITELRDVTIQQDTLRFRRNLERLGEILAYEISKKLDFVKTDTETPLGISTDYLPLDQIVLGTILRAGLPLHQGMLNYFDRAENAFVSAYRQHHKDGSFEINVQYVTCPNLDGKTLIIADSMLATGASMSLTIKELENYGKPKNIIVATVIASTEGVRYLRRKHPKVQIWMGACDEELTAKSYIVPGLGDAGDLSFGEKLQD
ncbi:MAG: uracil phosphoribosyltransferase [Bacteroidota bacterium]